MNRQQVCVVAAKDLRPGDVAMLEGNAEAIVRSTRIVDDTTIAITADPLDGGRRREITTAIADGYRTVGHGVC